MATKRRPRGRTPTTQQAALASAISQVQSTSGDPSARVRDRATKALGEALAPLIAREAKRMAAETGEAFRDCQAEMLAAAWEGALAFDPSKGVYAAHFFGSRYGKLPSARITASRRHARWCERHHFVDAGDLEDLGERD